MKKVVSLHEVAQARPLSPSVAIRRVRTLWNKGEVKWTRHAERRLQERNLDLLDVENTILRGYITETSKPGPDGCWRYKVVGTTVNKEPMSCIVEMEGKLIIITVIV